MVQCLRLHFHLLAADSIATQGQDWDGEEGLGLSLEACTAPIQPQYQPTLSKNISRFYLQNAYLALTIASWHDKGTGHH